MLPTLSDRARAWLFSGLALALSLTASLLPGTSTALVMLTPAVAVLLMLLVCTREGWTRQGWASLGLHRAGFRLWPLAVGLPIAVLGTGHALLWLSSFAELSPTESVGGSGLAMLPLHLLGNIVFASVTVSLTEEIGWRGYLLPRLASGMGVRRALVVSGLIHGVWHLPVMLLTGLYHPNGSRLLVVPLFLTAVTAAGVFLGWLRLRSASLWPSVLAHSSHNAAMTWFAAYTIVDTGTLEVFASEWGVFTVLAYAGIAAVLLTRRDRRVDTPPERDVRWPEAVAASSTP